MIRIPRGAIVVELVDGNAVVVERFRDVGLGGRIVSVLWYTSEVGQGSRSGDVTISSARIRQGGA